MKNYLSILSIVFAFVLAGCSGKSGSNKQNAANNEAGSKAESSAQMSDAGNAIHVFGVDQMKFVVDHKSDNLQTGETMTVNGNTYYLLKGITAKAGSDLTIKLTTISKLPATAMSHNWCLLKQGTDDAAFAKAGALAKDNDYIDPKMKDQVIKETGLVAPGKTKSITFTVPDKAGDYDYLCTFPGHYTSGMTGVLTVQ